MFTIYALQSDTDGGLYVGFTSDLTRRLHQHNSGQTRSTRSRRPLKLIYSEQCGTRLVART